jgi:hypothetical protein
VTRRVVGGVDDVTRALQVHGLLLLQDATARSLVTLVAGDVVKGSWWAHPRGNEMFAIAEALEAITSKGQRIKIAKLVDGKVTFVHERLWPALHAVGSAREPWQMAKLTAEARALLRKVDDGETTRAKGAAVKLLEARLLVDARAVHTDQGRHETELRAWPASRVSVDDGQAALAAAAQAIGAAGRLPWL